MAEDKEISQIVEQAVSEVLVSAPRRAAHPYCVPKRRQSDGVSASRSWKSARSAGGKHRSVPARGPGLPICSTLPSQVFTTLNAQTENIEIAAGWHGAIHVTGGVIRSQGKHDLGMAISRIRECCGAEGFALDSSAGLARACYP